MQLNYSIGARAAEARLLPLAAERKLAVLVNRPFEDGALFGRVRGKELPPWASEIDCGSWAQFFLKFIRRPPVGDLRDPGDRQATAHARQRRAPATGGCPTRHMRERMAQYVASL